jgi:hypothetical protein
VHAFAYSYPEQGFYATDFLVLKHMFGFVASPRFQEDVLSL